MNIKIIQAEFGKECECEGDVVKQCILKVKEIQEALRTLGVDITRSQNLNYIYTYLILKLQDTKKEKNDIDFYKAQHSIFNDE